MKSYFFNIHEFGATGDGVTKDTAALQKAIDVCHDSGGGRVLVPSGRYLCGTIFLKSNVELHLSAGATIVGSPDAEDYNAEDVFPENQAFASDDVTARHLVIAYRQDNVSITGAGTIDGNGSAFFEPLPAEKIASYRFHAGNFPLREWRPGQMVFFCRCTNVAVRDVRLQNPPYWTLFLLGCVDVQVRGLKIENPPPTRNGDGLDIDCCRNVTVSDCIIRVGDDCITVRANKKPLGENAQPCENVVVSNCILSSPCNAIRVGVGDGHIRNCLFNNIVIPEASRGISIVSLYRKGQLSQHGATIENVHFSNFHIDADVPITVGTGAGSEPPAAIRDISFSRSRVTAWAAAQFVGTPEVPLERVRLSDCDWTVRGGTDSTQFHREMPESLSHHGYNGRDGAPALPSAIYGKHIKDISCDNIRLRWDGVGAVWRDGFFFDEVHGIDLRDLVLRQPQQNGGAAVSCRASSEIAMARCRAAAGTSTFLQLDSSAHEAQLSSTANDLSQAALPIETDISVEV